MAEVTLKLLLQKQPTPAAGRGRPPSYPAVVTTTTTTPPATGISAVGCTEISSSATMAAATPPSTLEEAIRLYERDGNAAASLDACQRLVDGTRGGADGAPTPTVPFSRMHNQAVLSHLSSLRNERCRVRRRPLSFDVTKGGSQNTDEESTDDAKKENMSAVITAVISSVTDDQIPALDAAVGRLYVLYSQLVGLYNICLSTYAEQRYQDALEITMIPFLAAMKSISIDSEGVDVVLYGDEIGNTAAQKKRIRAEKGAADISIDKKEGEVVTPISYLAMAVRIAFLVLDCALALNAGNGMGMGEIIVLLDPDDSDNNNPTIAGESILTWVEKISTALLARSRDGSIDREVLEPHESLRPDELKFRLHLYRSRLLNIRNMDADDSNKKDLEGNTRASRKELKNAMDIYQNKLCVVTEEESNKDHGSGSKSKGEQQSKKGGSKGGGKAQSSKGKQDASETTSVSGSLTTSVSDALWSEGKAGGGVARATFEGMPSKTSSSQQQLQTSHAATIKVKKETPNLQVRHESILYLKANVEYLRGNPTKSLKLCAEARSAGKKSRAGVVSAKRDSETTTKGEDENPGITSSSLLDSETEMANGYDEAIYYNNLGLLHQSASKVHLALYYYSTALSHSLRVNFNDKNTNSAFWSDGMARPDITADILHNTSICALQAQDFNTAYQCMNQCVQLSPAVFGSRARSFLRLAQSCIGKI